MGTSVDAELVVVVECILLHVFGSQLPAVALLVVGKVERLIGPSLVEGALVARLLCRLLQPVGDVDELSLVAPVIELVHLFLQLYNVIGNPRLCPRPKHARH